jgi:TPR repeat protein
MLTQRKLWILKTVALTLCLFCMHNVSADARAPLLENGLDETNTPNTLTPATDTALTKNAAEEAAPESPNTHTQEELKKITAIKPKPLKNPHALLVEMAFKFKRSGGSVSNYQEVHDQYCKEARDGNADAQYAVGWMYEYGKGRPADRDMANLFYNMAAEQHHELALKAISDVAVIQMDAKLPDCMQPDPPPVIVETPKPEDSMTNIEENAISERTAALFMSQKRIFKIVNKLATKYKIDANLVMSFIAIESGFNVLATSPKNAQGLMQLIPETASRFGVKDAYKPEDNIKGGIAYLQWLLAYYQGNVELVAAAYNSGERAVDKYKGVPPYEETRLYVKKIAKLYNKLVHPYKEDWVPASPILNPNFINTNYKRKM